MRNKSLRWAQSLTANCRGLSVQKANKRVKLSLALSYLSNEHFHSIITLSTKGIAASGFALLRPQYEAFIRALWINHCATLQEIEGIYTNKGFKKSNFEMISALEALERYDNKPLSHLKSIIWKRSHDFSHGGSIQAKWHMNKDTIGSMYTQKEINGLLTVSSSISLSNTLAMAELCNDENASTKIIASHKRIF